MRLESKLRRSSSFKTEAAAYSFLLFFLPLGGKSLDLPRFVQKGSSIDRGIE